MSNGYYDELSKMNHRDKLVHMKKDSKGEYVRMTPELLEKLKQPGVLEDALKKVRMGQSEVLAKAIRKKILTVDEYVSQYKGKYINKPNGGDTFIEYMGVVMHFKEMKNEKKCEEAVFVTQHDNILADREALKDRFGVKIISVEEMIDLEIPG